MTGSGESHVFGVFLKEVFILFILNKRKMKISEGNDLLAHEAAAKGFFCKLPRTDLS